MSGVLDTLYQWRLPLLKVSSLTQEGPDESASHPENFTQEKLAMALITAFDLRRNIDAFTLELENLDLVADAEKNFVVIMKAGKTYKNTLG